MDRYDTRELLVTELQTALGYGGDGYGDGSYGDLSIAVSMDAPQEAADFDTTDVYVTYDRRVRALSYNDASTAPTRVNRDSDDHVTSEDYPDYFEAQFPVTVHGLEPNEADRAHVLGDIRQHFDRYQHGPWDTRELDQDCLRVYTSSSDAVDNTETEPPIRRDTVVVHIEYARYVSFTDDQIEQIDREYE